MPIDLKEVMRLWQVKQAADKARKEATARANAEFDDAHTAYWGVMNAYRIENNLSVRAMYELLHGQDGANET